MNNMDLTSCREALRAITDRLDPILLPLGFTLPIGQGGTSSGGVFVSRFYSRGGVRIGLIYRASSGLGAVIYENSYSNVSHDDLMRHLGHADDYKLAYDKDRFASYSKDGGDVVEALAYDLQNFALDVLVGDKARFDQIIKDALDARLREWGIRPRASFGQVIKDALVEWARKWGIRR